MELAFSPRLLAIAIAAAIPFTASAADTPAVATSQNGHAGYDHPNQYLVTPATKIADNLMPVMSHPAQDKDTRQKLAELEKKTGKKPNPIRRKMKASVYAIFRWGYLCRMKSITTWKF